MIPLPNRQAVVEVRVDVQALLRLDSDLKNFVEDIFVSLRRKGWQERSFCYMTGLMLDGRRKSVQPMAKRLDEPNEQSLHNFVANTPWDPVPVRRQLARRMQQVIDPSSWVFDDTGFVKDGRMSPCVARQYTGTVGKITNCQVATTLHLATDQASCPINWRLFMPESWDPASDKASADVAARRTAAGIPDDEHHRPKWQLITAQSCGNGPLSGTGIGDPLRRRGAQGFFTPVTTHMVSTPRKSPRAIASSSAVNHVPVSSSERSPMRRTA
jgi:hypothetical protein